MLGPRHRGLTTMMLAQSTMSKEGIQGLVVLRPRPKPNLSPTKILDTPVVSTSLHLILSVFSDFRQVQEGACSPPAPIHKVCDSNTCKTQRSQL